VYKKFYSDMSNLKSRIPRKSLHQKDPKFGHRGADITRRPVLIAFGPEREVSNFCNDILEVYGGVRAASLGRRTSTMRSAGVPGGKKPI